MSPLPTTQIPETRVRVAFSCAHTSCSFSVSPGRVPENTIKYAVGLLLSAFGTFWVGEGVGVEWTLQDPTIVVMVGVYAAVSAVLVWYLKPKGGLAAGTEELAI